MTFDWNDIEPGGLEYYGHICASFSHEIKNMMATIHETAALLQDIVNMGGRKLKKLDPEKLEKISSRIVAQVKRGDETVKAFNRFAHSSDSLYSHADVGEILNVIQSITKRFASMKRVEAVVGDVEQISLATSPYLLFTFLGRTLERSFALTAPGNRITLTARSGAGGVEIRFAGLTDLKGPEDFSESIDKALIEILEARLTAEADAVVITLPHKLAAALGE